MKWSSGVDADALMPTLREFRPSAQASGYDPRWQKTREDTSISGGASGLPPYGTPPTSRHTASELKVLKVLKVVHTAGAPVRCAFLFAILLACALLTVIDIKTLNGLAVGCSKAVYQVRKAV